MHIQAAKIVWQEGLPYLAALDDSSVLHSIGLSQTMQVFLEANHLASRFVQLKPNDSFTLAEIGFGAGLNFLATWQLWNNTAKEADTWLHVVSSEQHPLTAEDLNQVLALWPELQEYAQLLLQQYPPLTAGWHRLIFAKYRITLTLILGDTHTLLPDVVAKVDAWFLNAFALNKTPDTWQDLLVHVATLSNIGTTLSTTQHNIKHALEAVGFSVSTQHTITTATLDTHKTLPANWQDTAPFVSSAKKALIIGAGIAGVSCARALALRGWQVTLIEQASHAMSAASGNPAAIIYPKLAPPHLSAWHFQQQAYLWLLNTLKDAKFNEVWQQTGLLWLLAGNQQREAEKLNNHPWPSSLVHKVNAQQATQIAGLTIDSECLYFPQAGYLQPRALADIWLNHPNINCIYNTSIVELTKQTQEWLAFDAQQNIIAQAPVVIIANALAAQQLSVSQDLPLTAVRGQIGQFESTAALSSLKSVLCYGGYLTPAYNNKHCIGALFWPKNTNTEVTEADHLHNQQLVQHFLPQLAENLPPISTWQGRAALRAQTTDYLPLVGALPIYQNFCQDYAAFKHGKQVHQSPVYHEGLYVSLGHGSKGFCYAPLAAEVIAAQLNNEPLPIAKQVLHALNPARFWVKQLKRGTIKTPTFINN